MSSPHSRSKQTLKVGDLIICECRFPLPPRSGRLHYGVIQEINQDGYRVAWTNAPGIPTMTEGKHLRKITPEALTFLLLEA